MPTQTHQNTKPSSSSTTKSPPANKSNPDSKPSPSAFLHPTHLSRNQTKYTLIDIRSPPTYTAGHIPGAINIPFDVPTCTWISLGPDSLLLEMPEKKEFFTAMKEAGVAPDHAILVYGGKGNKELPIEQANVIRVAMTLKVAGYENVGVLKGGFETWVKEGKEVERGGEKGRGFVEDNNDAFEGMSYDQSVLVGRDYVKSAIGRAVLLDARDPDVYHGEVVEEWAEKAGHIPSAKNLPMLDLVDELGDFKDEEDLKRLVDEVIGEVGEDTEITTYCGVGGYGSALWFVLTSILGFKNVKFYDGSAQDWVRYYDMETT
ncbi:Rhodanese-like protein [Sporormia fimetaria CBS 119925]|uniref:Rhodanese-like protein n=1 Tax=Sporormia fimetaria CBS 119925 TaxID=1340428 RepID=A0A6A6VAF2_9PLEO|nr:Rhodanese-like protein [Sporormia fimetaria CBS 119925]